MGVTALEAHVRTDRSAGLDWWDNHGWPPVPLPILMVIVLVAVLAGGAARISYAATYQPLEIGTGAIGPATGEGFKPISDGFETTRWLLVAKPGTTATFEFGVYNNGSDPVTIYDAPQSPDDPVVISMAWAPFRDGVQPRRLPVVVRPHQLVELRLSIRKPTDCPGNGMGAEINSLTIHYGAFGFNHSIEAPMVGDGFAPIEVCY